MTAYNTIEELEYTEGWGDVYPLLVDDSSLLLSDLIGGPTQIWIRDSELETWSYVSDLTPPPPVGKIFISIPCGTRDSTYIAIPTSFEYRDCSIAIYSNNGGGTFSLFIDFPVNFAPSDIRMTNEFIFLWNMGVYSPTATIEIYDYSGTLIQTIILDGSLYKFDTSDCISCWEDILAIGVVDRAPLNNSRIIIYKYTSGWSLDTVFDLGDRSGGIPVIDCANNRIAIVTVSGVALAVYKTYCDVIKRGDDGTWDFEQENIQVGQFFINSTNPQIKINNDGDKCIIRGFNFGGGGYAGTITFKKGEWKESGDMSNYVAYEWPVSMSPSGDRVALTTYGLDYDYHIIIYQLPNLHKKFWVVGSEARIYRYDEQSSWVTQTCSYTGDSNYHLTAVWAVDGNNVYAIGWDNSGGENRNFFIKTTNSGNNWKSWDDPGLSNTYKVTCMFGRGDYIYVGYSDFSTYHDWGSSWNDVGGIYRYSISGDTWDTWMSAGNFVPLSMWLDDRNPSVEGTYGFYVSGYSPSGDVQLKLNTGMIPDVFDKSFTIFTNGPFAGHFIHREDTILNLYDTPIPYFQPENPIRNDTNICWMYEVNPDGSVSSWGEATIYLGKFAPGDNSGGGMQLYSAPDYNVWWLGTKSDESGDFSIERNLTYSSGDAVSETYSFTESAGTTKWWGPGENLGGAIFGLGSTDIRMIMWNGSTNDGCYVYSKNWNYWEKDEFYSSLVETDFASHAIHGTWASASSDPPYLYAQYPIPDQIIYDNSIDISFQILEPSYGVDPDSILIYINGSLAYSGELLSFQSTFIGPNSIRNIIENGYGFVLDSTVIYSTGYITVRVIANSIGGTYEEMDETYSFYLSSLPSPEAVEKKDLVIIEDSADGFKKKKLQLSTIFTKTIEQEEKGIFYANEVLDSTTETSFELSNMPELNSEVSYDRTVQVFKDGELMKYDETLPDTNSWKYDSTTNSIFFNNDSGSKYQFIYWTSGSTLWSNSGGSGNFPPYVFGLSDYYSMRLASNLDYGFPSSVATDYRTVAVGEMQAGKVYIYYYRYYWGWDNPRGYYTVPPLYESYQVIDGGGSNFGKSISIYGDVLVIGAPSHGTKGAIYIYVKNNAYQDTLDIVRQNMEWIDWVFFQKIVPSGDCVDFGSSISIYENKIAVGSLYPGEVYIYKNSGLLWEEEDILTNSLPTSLFGFSVDLKNNNLIIGAPTETGNGAAYVYIYTAGNWFLQQRLVASDGSVADNFGRSVSIYGDKCIIGAPFTETQGYTHAGATYIYERSAGVWINEFRLDPYTAGVGSRTVLYGGWYGNSVAIRDNIIVISSPLSGHYISQDNGNVWVFRFINGEWKHSSTYYNDTTVYCSDGNNGHFLSVSDNSIVFSQKYYYDEGGLHGAVVVRKLSDA